MNNQQLPADQPSLGKAIGVFFLVLLLGGALSYGYLNWETLKTFLDRPAQQEVPPTPAQSSNPGEGSPESTPEVIPAEEPGEARRIQVEVLNGCGVSGIADRFTRYLRDQNIDVVSKGNYITFDLRQSRILDRVGNYDRALEVATVLKLPRERIEVKKDDNLQLDATIILGADYKQLAPFK
ncbi:MAG TPA: LytR C-terminal domain-containing protein [Calditrichia bacterium]|nr:LytR C-terminal domain-containing protein [Calditrichia bacterium]